MPGLRLLAGLAALLIAGVSGLAAQPPGPKFISSSGSGHVSSSVSVIWRTRSRSSELQGIDLLILVRGRPGWFTEPAANRGPSVSSSAYTTVRTATRDIEVHIDLGKKVVQFGDQLIDLQQGNVIFIDKVDEPSGPIVTEILTVEAQIPFARGVEMLKPVLETPGIYSYLRCETPGPRPLPRTLCTQLAQP
jgi:hypothetical protein